MSQDIVVKTGIGGLLALITAPEEFIFITLWLLFGNTVLSAWANIIGLAVKNITTVSEVLGDVFYTLLKQMGVLFFLLTGATAISKFGPTLGSVESAMYIGISFWILTIMTKNASKIMSADGFSSMIQNLLTKTTSKIEK
jgi:hypothetical protein